MPTPEEIKEIAREYARCTCIGTFDAQQRAEDEKIEYDFALPVLEWLSKDYCIVPKSELAELYKESSQNYRIANNIDKQAAYYAKGKIDALTTLFGTALFNEGKE